MKQRIYILMLAILCLMGCVCNKPANYQVSPKTLLSTTIALVTAIHSSPSAVTPSSMTPGSFYTYCSGVWISQTVILTAKHCVTAENDKPVGAIIRFKTRNEVSVVENEITQSPPHYGLVIAAQDNLDLALVSSIDNIPPHSYTNISEDNIEIGQDVQIVGHTAGLQYSYLKGSISAFRNKDGVIHIQVSSAAYKGNSGGAAFDSKGNIIGICSTVYLLAPNVTFFVHRDEIKEFIHDNKPL